MLRVALPNLIHPAPLVLDRKRLASIHNDPAYTSPTPIHHPLRYGGACYPLLFHHDFRCPHLTSVLG